MSISLITRKHMPQPLLIDLLGIIRDKLGRYQKLNHTKNVIKAVKDVVIGYNDAVYRSRDKSPNEITVEDVEKNTDNNRQHNQEVFRCFFDNVSDKIAGILTKKNAFDKGDKIKLVRGMNKIEGKEGYNLLALLKLWQTLHHLLILKKLQLINQRYGII